VNAGGVSSTSQARIPLFCLPEEENIKWGRGNFGLTEDFIIIRKGPITPREINIPYERIQDVYVDQDIVDRILGLYDVHLSSATVSSGMQAHIDGVEKSAADGLRAFLLETVSRKIKRK